MLPMLAMLPPDERTLEQRWQAGQPRPNYGRRCAGLIVEMGVGIVIVTHFNAWPGWLLAGHAAYRLVHDTTRWLRAKRVREAAERTGYRLCPGCHYDLGGASCEAVCPECGLAVDVTALAGVWQRILEQPPSHAPVEWIRLRPEDMETARAAAVLGLLGGMFFVSAVVTLIVIRNMDLAIACAVFFGIFGGAATLARMAQGRRSWEYLEARLFRICPRCRRDVWEQDADSNDAPCRCPRCGLGYTRAWREGAWRVIYGRSARARPTG